MMKKNLNNIEDKIMRLKFIKQIILLLALSGHSTVAVASNFKLNSEARIKTQISKSGLNRISMLPHRITQVTGDESKYKLKFDDDGSNIYIMPIGKVGETIELSIKSTTHLVQDMLLEVANIAGRSINLQQGKDSKLPEKLIDAEIKQMLKAMMHQEKGKYYVQAGGNRTIANKLTLDIKQVQTYKWDNITGVVIDIKNQSKSPVNISEHDIATLYQQVKAVSIDGIHSSVAAKSKIKAYVITLNTKARGGN